MQKAQFIQRLERFRGSVRRRLVGYGLLAVPAGGLAATLTVIFLDWALVLPATLRIIVTGFFFLGFLLATHRWIIQPLRAKLDVPRLAHRLERHFPELREQLSSAVNFVHQPDAGSPALVQHMLHQTDRLLENLKLEQAVSAKPLATRGILLGAGVLALAGLALAAPSWLRTGVHRYLAPYGPVEWPRSVSIVPLTGDLTVAVGESATLGMRIERGLTDNLRGLVHLRESDGTIVTRALQREPDGLFRATIDSVADDLQYWFEAGDDSTEKEPRTIQVVRRPVVVEALASVEPPPYATRRTPREHDLASGSVRAPHGGTVTVSVRSSKPIGVDPATGMSLAALATENQGRIPLQSSSQHPHELSTRLTVEGDVDFRVELVDETGLTNHGSPRYSIQAVSDAPPTVTVMEPRAESEITTGGSVNLVLRAEDDFGLSDFRLVAIRESDGQTTETSLSEEVHRLPESERGELLIHHTWSAAGLGLTAGDRLVITAEAVDNHPQAAVDRTGKSAPIRVRIISDVEFEIRLRDDLARLEERIRRAVVDQSELLDRTAALIRPDDDDRPWSDVDREGASVNAMRQGRLARRVGEVGRRLEDLADQARRNRPHDPNIHGQMAALAQALGEIAGGPMTQAGEELHRAHEQVSKDGTPHDPQAALRSAAHDQETAANRLRLLGEVMAQWGTFQGLATKTRDLLDRQQAIQDQTAQIGQSTLGKPRESLSADEAAALKRAQRQQEQLHADVEQHLARLADLAKPNSGTESADQQSVEAALRAARAQELTRHLKAAGDAIGENRTSAAALEQRASSEALRGMIQALNRRERRELENLKKDVERSAELIEALIKEQELLQAQVKDSARDTAGWSAFQQEQRRLKGNTRLLAEELAESRRLAPAAAPTRDAVAPMEKAEAHLRGQQSDPAITAQDEAIGFLKDALLRLREIDTLLADEEFLRSLGEIRDELEAMLNAQVGINDGAEKLRAASAQAGRLNRTEAREASRLAQQQQENRARIAALRPALAKVVVYDWALERVGGWMDFIRLRLDDRRLDDELSVAGKRIVRELDQLVRALAETQNFPKKQDFADSSAEGGEGEGGSAQAKPVPPLAELLVLKAKQLEINGRTRNLAETVDLDQASESQLRELKVLAEDQSEVRRLAERITKGAETALEEPNE